MLDAAKIVVAVVIIVIVSRVLGKRDLGEWILDEQGLDGGRYELTKTAVRHVHRRMRIHVGH